MEVVSEDYKTRITITDALRKDTGIYTIIAENEVGRDEAEVEFVVLGKLLIINYILYVLKSGLRKKKNTIKNKLDFYRCKCEIQKKYFWL